jgi:hypothetical protein
MEPGPAECAEVSVVSTTAWIAPIMDETMRLNDPEYIPRPFSHLIRCVPPKQAFVTSIYRTIGYGKKPSLAEFTLPSPS